MFSTQSPRAARSAPLVLAACLFSLAQVAALASCAPAAVVRLDRDLLFTLKMGKLEDQLSLFEEGDGGAPRKTRFCMRDGFLYIANGEGKKILEFNSYGDLLSMIYDPESNPESITLRGGADVVESLMKRASPYPFNAIGEIAVNSAKEIFVEDRLPEERRVFDEENGVSLDKVILRFKHDGSYNDYLGQEGIGGTPFPYVLGLYSTANEETVVVSRMLSSTRDAWLVHWFGPQGNLLHDLAIERDELPMPPADGPLIADLEAIVPDVEGRRLYLYITYSQEIYDPSTKTRAGIVFHSAHVQILDPATGARLGDTEVPAYSTEGEGGRTIVRTFSLLGAARNGHLFFLLPRPALPYEVMVLDAATGVAKKASIAVAEEETLFNAFHVSIEGILAGLLATETEVRAVWWKLDSFTGDF